MKRWILFGGACVLFCLLCLIGWWIWDLGRLPEKEPDRVVLIVHEGGVYHLNAGEDIERSAKSGMELKAGDRIRTSATSSASIRMNGWVEIRLDEETTIELSEADPERVRLRWRLKEGRAWSLLSPAMNTEMLFQAEAGDLNVLGQGASFSLMRSKEDRTTVYVDRGIVRISHPEGEDVWLSSGKWPGNIAETEQTEEESEWVQKNKESDKRTSMAFATYFSENPLSQEKIYLGGWTEPLRRWSENFRSGGSKETCGAMEEMRIYRKVSAIRRLFQAGKKGMAMQEAGEWKRGLEQRYESEDTCVQTEEVRDAIGRSWLSLRIFQPNAEAYPLKLELEGLYESVLGGMRLERMFGKAIFVDARLDEWESIRCAKEIETGREELKTAVEQGLRRIRSEIDSFKEDENFSVLTDRIQGQEKRLEDLDMESCDPPSTKEAQNDLDIRDMMEE